MKVIKIVLLLSIVQNLDSFSVSALKKQTRKNIEIS
jgi:hypothetical protein